jgi:hypothetical protein
MIKVTTDNGYMLYSSNYYTVVGEYIVRNYDAKVVALFR